MFPAKILLFGEYSLMHGSSALSIPFRNYGGQWSRSTCNEGSTQLLLNFAGYLEDKQNEVTFKIDIQRFRKDISLGLYFDSTIPISYGLGSSGALCAAFYEQYVINQIPSNCSDHELLELKGHLSFLEKYFHGTSSGMDPLVSYTNALLLFKNAGDIERLTANAVFTDSISVFLVDTEKYGNTGTNINIFNDLLKEEFYTHELKSNYNPLVNKCIENYIEHRTEAFFTAIYQLSKSQQSLFEPMIPSEFLKYFQLAQDTAKFSLKLCGSGGGGFLLGFTSDIAYVTKLFLADHIKLITVKF